MKLNLNKEKNGNQRKHWLEELNLNELLQEPSQKKKFQYVNGTPHFFTPNWILTENESVVASHQFSVRQIGSWK